MESLRGKFIAGARVHHPSHCCCESTPCFRILRQPFFATGGESVVFCSAVRFAAVPSAGKEATLLQAVEGRIKRPLFNTEHLIGNLPNTPGYSKPVVGSVRDRFEDHHVERPLKQFRGFVWGFAARMTILLIGIHVFAVFIGG